MDGAWAGAATPVLAPIRKTHFVINGFTSIYRVPKPYSIGLQMNILYYKLVRIFNLQDKDLKTSGLNYFYYLGIFFKKASFDQSNHI